MTTLTPASDTFECHDGTTRTLAEMIEVLEDIFGAPLEWLGILPESAG